MKKLYQRILSMGLSLSMLFSMAVTAGAVDVSDAVSISVTGITESGATLEITDNNSIAASVRSCRNELDC